MHTAAVSLVLLLILLFAAPPAVYAIGRIRPRAAGLLACGISAAAFVAVWRLRALGGAHLILEWAPSWGLRLDLTLDGLGAAYALTATGIGFVVLVYSTRYMPAHLEAEGQPARDVARFYALMLLFMAAMVGLVVARELYAIVVFWDLTAVVSFLLIGTGRVTRESMRAASTAVVVTAGSAVLLLVAAVLLHVQTGSTLLDEVRARADGGPLLTAAAICIVIAGLAKSAQVPLHFWLPRAMVAPTPVSAYLHSAAMVAAGVFLLSRFHPILALTDGARPLMLAIGAASIVTGSVLALFADEIKRVLAYSTIAQYGYVMVLLGFGGPSGASAAVFYVLAHALVKSALFLTAGAAIEALHGRSRLSEAGGLARHLPGLAVASAVAAAGLSALPPTVGFFKDELFFKAALEHGPIAAGGAVATATLTFAYTWRWWIGIFLGPARHELHRPPALLTAVVAALAALTTAAGLFPGVLASLAQDGAGVIVRADVHVDAAWHADWRAEYGMALTAIALGALLLAAVRRGGPAHAGLLRLGRAGPDAIYAHATCGLARLSDYLHDVEVRDLRDRLSAVLVPGSILLLTAISLRPLEHGFRAGPVAASDIPLVCAVAVATLAAVAATRPTRHLSLVVALSTVSFSMAIVFALFGAPDVALVAVLIQTVVTLLLVVVISLFPQEVSRRAAQTSRTTPGRFTAITGLASAAMFAMTWAILSWPAHTATPDRYVQLAPEAHAGDAVTAVLADFRGLDTMGEATVVAIALVGVATLLRAARP